MLTVVVLTSSISVLLTLGIVTLTRPARAQKIVQVRPATPTGQVSNVADVAALADKLGPSIAQLEATSPSGQVRGSAVILRSDGMMLTAHHLVAKAEALKVVLDDGRNLTARLVGSDANTDVAVIRADVDSNDFIVAPFGSAVDLKVGQQAITIGSPATESGGPLVTVGVVSALGQPVEGSGAHLLDMIQTNAIAPGCSGGAVVDQNGQVIGIAAMNQAGESGVIGFATPIDVARQVAAQLIADGKVTMGWLGIKGRSVSTSRAKSLGIKGGAVVQSVTDGSPAAVAGLTTADVIVELDGKPVTSMASLVVSMRAHRPGDKVVLALLRAGERQTVPVILAAAPAATG